MKAAVLLLVVALVLAPQYGEAGFFKKIGQALKKGVVAVRDGLKAAAGAVRDVIKNANIQVTYSRQIRDASGQVGRLIQSPPLLPIHVINVSRWI